VLALAVAVAVVTPADAANREHQLLMADLRILQEQSQQVQNALGTLTSTLATALATSVTESFKTVTIRIDEQMMASRRSVADQRVVVETLTSDVRVLREKLDDNSVRLGSLTQEIEALRALLQQQNLRPAGSGSGAAAGAASASGGAGNAAVPVGLSPQRLWDAAYADYTAGQYALAVQGFEMYIKSFPKSDMSDNAQVAIGNSFLQDGKPDKALDAYDKAIRLFPTGDSVPEAYYKKGLALQNLKDLEGAREAWEYCVRIYPESDAGRQAKQRLDQIKRP
jgi:TolA-binding protein